MLAIANSDLSLRMVLVFRLGFDVAGGMLADVAEVSNQSNQ
ncbi:hypothetical protein ACS3QZ_20065 (plasmid) [Shimia sp. W99]